MKKEMHLFLQLAKVDEAKREVYGVATAEVVDKEGEIFDYRTSKPYFESWSDEISKATSGKSLGNVREMHQPSAVGKLVDISFDDELQQIQVGAKIVDDVAWKKCAEGVYTGFSIGGSYVKSWPDGEFVRFTANPVEISVVDNPCVPSAHFTAVKADGTSEVRKFALKEKKETAKPQEVRKDMGDVSCLAYILQQLVYLQQSSFFEAEYEQDASGIPAELADWAKSGGAILARMTTEELDELMGTLKTVSDKLGKRGARHSAETQAHHEAIAKCMGKITKAAGEAQDHCDALMGKEVEEAAKPSITKTDSAATPEIRTEEVTEMEAKDKATLEKAQTDSASALTKITALETQVSGLATKEEVNKGFEKLAEVLNKMVEKMAPAPEDQTVARTTVTVTKEGDSPSPREAEPDLSKMSANERAKHEMKKAFSQPLTKDGIQKHQYSTSAQ